jgi:hypothetical protein
VALNVGVAIPGGYCNEKDKHNVSQRGLDDVCALTAKVTGDDGSLTRRRAADRRPVHRRVRPQRNSYTVHVYRTNLAALCNDLLAVDEEPAPRKCTCPREEPQRHENEV